MIMMMRVDSGGRMDNDDGSVVTDDEDEDEDDDGVMIGHLACCVTHTGP